MVLLSSTLAYQLLMMVPVQLLTSNGTFVTRKSIKASTGLKQGSAKTARAGSFSLLKSLDYDWSMDFPGFGEGGLQRCWLSLRNGTFATLSVKRREARHPCTCRTVLLFCGVNHNDRSPRCQIRSPFCRRHASGCLAPPRIN
jgi:hypothetical protein